MATKAIHQLGDISNDTPNICIITGEDEDNYIGSWVEGLGFFNVKFPKKTTRPLTEAEIDHFDGQAVQINSQPPRKLNVK